MILPTLYRIVVHRFTQKVDISVSRVAFYVDNIAGESTVVGHVSAPFAKGIILLISIIY